VDVAQLDHAVIVQFSGVAQSRTRGSQQALRPALHIVNIDFELIASMSTFYRAMH